MKKIFNLGIDCDGVLFPFTELFINFVKQETGIKYPIPNNFRMSEEWKMDRDVWFKLYEKFIFKNGLEINKIYSNATSSIKELHNLGHKIHIITHRVYPNSSSKLKEKMISSTIKWLNKSDIYFDSLTFIEQKDLINVDFLVDDAIHNLEKVHKDTVPICLARNWNKNWKGVRIKNLKVFANLIKNLSHKDGDVL